MNIAQIEINLQKLIAIFNKQSFIYDLLLAYGLPKASITQLKKGNLNLSKVEGEISWKKKLFFREEFKDDLHLTISELAKAVKRAVGSTNEIVYDATKPDGTPRKLVDVSRLFSLGWKPEVSLEDGLSRTYEWYLKNVDNLDE